MWILRPLCCKLGKAEKPFLPSAPQSLLKRLLSPPFYLPSTLWMFSNPSVATSLFVFSHTGRALQWAEPYPLGWSRQNLDIMALQPLQSVLPLVPTASHPFASWLGLLTEWRSCWAFSGNGHVPFTKNSVRKEQLNLLKWAYFRGLALTQGNRFS